MWDSLDGGAGNGTGRAHTRLNVDEDVLSLTLCSGAWDEDETCYHNMTHISRGWVHSLYGRMASDLLRSRAL